MKVFIFDPLWPVLATQQNEALLKQSGAEIHLITQEAPLLNCKDLFAKGSRKILAVNPDYVGWSLPAESFKNIPGLSCIITQSTSYSWIDTDFARQQGITVINIRNFCTDAVADWATLMMLNVARRVPLLIKNNFSLNFGSDYQTYRGINLRGKKAGIIGLGNIGSAIATRCQGLGMEVCYWSNSPKISSWMQTDLKTLFEISDVIFPCMANNDQTKHLITNDMLESMIPSAIFISVVHKYYNHDLLLERVRNGSLFGYGFEAEPAKFSEPEGNVWAAPAYAWCTDGSMRTSLDLFVQAIVEAVKGNFPNQVN